MEIRPATDVQRIIAAEALFDSPVQAAEADKFLRRQGHHLLIAYDDDGTPVGFVSGVEMVHPDKGTEMFLYELGVSDGHRRKGYGRALVTALAELARDRDCYGMWVLTEGENDAALATYRATGAERPDDDDTNMLAWDFTPTPAP
ncbi:GNAT family N-acetyltransferase [Stackebrandtia soli]|uniref:GNAT family N-acetyltransferase n=1 Tax=Stackebrandtia soli TaxID=1892856 RepID=UPI0039E9CC69